MSTYGKKNVYSVKEKGFLLKEDGFFLLLETGFKIIIGKEAYKKKNAYSNKADIYKKQKVYSTKC